MKNETKFSRLKTWENKLKLCGVKTGYTNPNERQVALLFGDLYDLTLKYSIDLRNNCSTYLSKDKTIIKIEDTISKFRNGIDPKDLFKIVRVRKVSTRSEINKMKDDIESALLECGETCDKIFEKNYDKLFSNSVYLSGNFSAVKNIDTGDMFEEYFENFTVKQQRNIMNSFYFTFGFYDFCKNQIDDDFTFFLLLKFVEISQKYGFKLIY